MSAKKTPKTLKARDIERLENTSLASVAQAAATTPGIDCGDGPCTSFTYIVCGEATEPNTNCCQCTACSVGTVCTIMDPCCTGVSETVA